MQYPSPIRILMHAGTPAERILVDWGQMIGALPGSGIEQAVAVEPLVGAEFAALGAMGNGQRSLRIEMQEIMNDAAAAAVVALDSDAAVEPRVQGLRIELANPMLGPGTPAASRCLVRWDCPDACVASGSQSIDGETVKRALELTIGDATAAIPDYPAPVFPELLRTSTERGDGAGIQHHDGQSWLRIRCIMPDGFSGNPVDGWSDGERLIELEWSTDLVTWATGHMQAAPVSDVVAGGTRTTWVESAHPQDCAELTSDQYLRWSRPIHATTWTLAQDIQSLRISGANISLPNFPYSMPADAATLQTDLRAAGYTGAEVEVDAGSQWWEIRLFDVETTNYDHTPGGLCDPGFEYRNIFGALNWAHNLRGDYFNPRFGPSLTPFVVRKKQFVRGRITRP